MIDTSELFARLVSAHDEALVVAGRRFGPGRAVAVNDQGAAQIREQLLDEHGIDLTDRAQREMAARVLRFMGDLAKYVAETDGATLTRLLSADPDMAHQALATGTAFGVLMGAIAEAHRG